MSAKGIATIAVVIVVIILGCTMFNGCIGKNELATYQIKQSISGDVEVIDTPGIYNKAFGTVHTYARSVQAFYSSSTKEGNTEDESITVHFNDGGTAKISVMVQFQMPTDAEKRKHLHQTFGGIEGVKQAVRAHLINCVKNTGPMMSATENQAARKGEFNQTVEEQLRKGIFGMRRVEVELKDRSGAQAQAQLLLSATTQPATPLPAPVMVWATEIVVDSKTGAPLIVEKSPLDDYGIVIQQFSITGTDYDDATKQQFAAKQQSFLKGEQSKAQREAELQQTAMIVQQGLRQKAEIESTENVKKTQQVIQATALSEVAEQTKKQAETVASQALAVAKLTKEAAETKASADAAVLQIAAEQSLKTAELNAKEASEKAKAVIALAEAEKKKIELAGALSEKDKMTLELESKTKIGVAEALSKINVPSTIISGEGKGSSLTENLLNITLLRNLGIAPTTQPAK